MCLVSLLQETPPVTSAAASPAIPFLQRAVFVHSCGEGVVLLPLSQPVTRHHAPLRAMQMKAAAFQFLHAAQQPCILHVMLHVAGREEAAHRPVHVLCWLRSKH